MLSRRPPDVNTLQVARGTTCARARKATARCRAVTQAPGRRYASGGARHSHARVGIRAATRELLAQLCIAGTPACYPRHGLQLLRRIRGTSRAYRIQIACSVLWSLAGLVLAVDP